ncbi:hypothetical protein Csac_2665 [Caldicellulosiruptor saccharolyticus DSM 8903]|uniref:Uncharacterized protein n=1 Tax=Caldicellulosiruptor saccharolyticus (strain ATCC 43494 / DSM 8903 / Tp8T 6331) TaxID=351627 RepID=A4XMV1_CALS8|nr:hypothetical protein [Caldicellulosiruptor saccharolyticus]ABP68236.1 hypothetical protein Csac_2665 [Caldicellulosiruptor saccharolyticus DSM 8903]
MWLIFVMLFILLAGIGAILVIYIQTKKDTTEHSFNKTTSTKNHKEKNNKKTSLKSLFNITNILEDGTVCIEGNTYSRIFYFSTPDFVLLSDSEQQLFENDLITIARTIDIPVQLFTTVQRVDTAAYIEILDNVINNIDTTEQIKMYTKALKDRLERLRTGSEFFVRKNYIILSVADQRQDIAIDRLELEAKKLFQLFKRASIKVFQLDRNSVLQLFRDILRRDSTLLVKKAIESGALSTILTGKGIVVHEDNKEDSHEATNKVEYSSATAGK